MIINCISDIKEIADIKFVDYFSGNHQQFEFDASRMS